MSETNPGMFDPPKPVNGKKFAIGLVIGTVLFFTFCMLATYYGAKAWTGVLNKKAMEKEREVEMQRMKDHEAKGHR